MSASNRNTRSSSMGSDSPDLQPRYLHALILQLQEKMQEMQQDNMKLRKEAQERQVKHEKEVAEVDQKHERLARLTKEQLEIAQASREKLQQLEDCVKRNAESIAKLAKQVKGIQPIFKSLGDNGKKLTDHVNNGFDKHTNSIRILQASLNTVQKDINDCAYNFNVCRHTQTQLSKLKASVEAGFTAAKESNLKRKDDADNMRRRITYLEGGKPVKQRRSVPAALTTSTTPEEPRPAPAAAQVHTLYDLNGNAALQVAELPTEPGVAVTIPLIPLF